MKARKALLYLVSIVIFGSISYIYFYIPSHAKEFLNKIEYSFNTSETSNIYVKNITDFNWDTVCVFSKNTPIFWLTQNSEKQFEEVYGYDYDVIKNDIPLRMSPAFKATFLFIEDQKVVRKITYNTYGLRWKGGELKNSFDQVFTNKESFFFLDDTATLNDGCIEKDNATFTKHYYQPNSKGFILLSNIKKEK